jgi:hypothetical protein
MADIRSDMPVLARHEGEWEGVYIHVDPENNELDRHKSELQCRFPADGEFAYYQINTYSWPDGRREEIHFPATYRDKAIWWDTDRIYGRAWELDERTVALTWTRKDLPGSYLYEMIQISQDGNDRARTWHWFVDDKLVKRTLIKERRTA